MMKNGGLREGSGRGKSGWFKGIFCNSSYELAYLIYCLDHEIPIERNKESWQYFNPEKNRLAAYYPDFIVDGMIVEIKGIKSEIDLIKLKAVDRPIKILYLPDLLTVFEYIKSKYQKTDETVIMMYESSRALYEHECKSCSKLFKTIRKIGMYCSRKCAGQGCRLTRKKNPVKSPVRDRCKVRLTDDEAKEIFDMNLPYARIGVKFGISTAMVGLIKQKKSYAWIHVP